MNSAFPNKRRSEQSGIEIQDDKDELGKASISTDIINYAKEAEEKHAEALERIEKTINEKLNKDNSPEARMGRRMMTLRAVYGEFMCTFLFFTPILGTIANATFRDFPPYLVGYLSAFVGGFQAIAVSFAFSSVSGAHFNPAISFALWVNGKLGARKCFLYIFVQLFASILSMAVIATMFDKEANTLYLACTVTPSNNRYLGNVFATEFFLTFILTYVAFTVVYSDAERSKKDSMSLQTISDSKGLTLYASTPQSQTGFAPFSIGFTIFSLSLIGGESGGAFNPARMFGPAIFSGKWDYLYLYWFAQLLGSTSAALLVELMFRIGLKSRSKNISSSSAIGTMSQVTPGIIEKHKRLSQINSINPIISKE